MDCHLTKWRVNEYDDHDGRAGRCSPVPLIIMLGCTKYKFACKLTVGLINVECGEERVRRSRYVCGDEGSWLRAICAKTQ